MEVLSYDELQAIWVEDNNITKGSLVKVTRTARDGEGGWDNEWSASMSEGVFEVSGIEQGLGISLRRTTKLDLWPFFSYPYFVLEPVALGIEDRKILCTVGRIAEVAHTLNKAYCELHGDTSQPSWEAAPLWQRISVMSGVEKIMDCPTTTAEQSHESWLACKKVAGWEYGPKKDSSLKLHPCMVHYSELPQYQRVKGDIFVSIVRVMIQAFSA